MADEEKGTSAWYKVPTWDGSPVTWRSFKREMDWWLCSLDLTGTMKYNLAARWLLRQTGVVRQRGEEFTPKELECVHEVRAIDPQSGEEVILTEADPLAGINKLLAALESINGKTELDKKGELRHQFYQELRRRPGERMSEFCTRFRMLVADLRLEGVTIPNSELGWFLKDKIGLDPIRKQLLDTALQGKESYEEVEGEVLRLFKELHVQDPLHRVSREQVTAFGRFVANRGGPGSARTSLPSSSSSMRSSIPSSASSMARQQVSQFRGNNNFRRPSAQSSSSGRQAFVTEQEDDAEPELEEQHEEELVPDEPEPQSLEEVLVTEAEVLATELEEAAEAGVDPSVLEDMEGSLEAAAESLLTMREARSKLQEVRKDRGFGKPSGSSGGKGSKPTGNQIAARKQSDKHRCFDCDLPGHWAGDPQCTKPGAGLGRKNAAKGKGSGGPPRQVKIVEALNTEHRSDVAASGSGDVHEVAVVSSVTHMPLTMALDGEQSSNEVMNAVTSLALDKRLVGALDTACNRTCAGEVWLRSYLDSLKQAPAHIRSSVFQEEESELFRFGNGGTQRSNMRWRVPAAIGDVVVMVWISIVPVPSLGCLLGRDFLDALGAVMSFAKKLIRFDYLNSVVLPLDQLAAGHFFLPLVPAAWPGPVLSRWRRLGQDGIVEVQISSREWLRRKLEASGRSDDQHHEHFVTEHARQAAELSLSGWPTSVGTSAQDSSVMSKSSVTIPRTTSSTSSRPHGDSKARHRDVMAVEQVQATRGAKMVSHVVTHAKEGRVAYPGRYALVVAAALASICSNAVSQHFQCAAVETSSRKHGFQQVPSIGTLPEGNFGRSVQRWESQCSGMASQSSWDKVGISGRSHCGRDAGSQGGQRCKHSSTSCPTSTSTRRSSSSGQRGPRIGGREKSHWTTRRIAGLEARSPSVGSSLPCGTEGRRDSGQVEDAGSSCGARDIEEKPGQIINRAGTSTAGFEVSNVTHISSGFASRQSAVCGYGTGSTAVGSSGGKVPDHDEPGDASFHAGGSPKLSSNRINPVLASHWGSTKSFDQRGTRRDQRSGDFRPERAKDAGDVRGELERGSQHGGLHDGGHLGLNPWKIVQDVKPGQQQLIAQAWQKHLADRKRLSVSAPQVRQVLQAEWEGEMNGFMNEVFMSKVDLSGTPGVTRIPALPTGSGTLGVTRVPALPRGEGTLGLTRIPALPVLCSEVYSATEAVVKEAQRRGHRTGTTMSLETGWDFTKRLDREAGRALVQREAPFCLVLAFPCRAWSLLMNLNPPPDLRERREEALVLLKYAIELAELQHANGRHFLLENPRTSKAWTLREMVEFLEKVDARLADFDMCRFNLKGSSGLRHKKATRMATSSKEIAGMIDGRKCKRNHPHQQVIGGSKITTSAGFYPRQLACALVSGMERQFEQDFRLKKGHDAMVSEVLANGDEAEEGGEFQPFPVDDPYSDSDDGAAGDSTSTPAVSPAIKQAVARLHANTGHRSNRRLARALTIAGAPKAIILAAKNHVCPICQEKRQPKSRRPASLPTPKDTSDQVNIDMFEVFDARDQKFFAVHLVDFATRFQMAGLLPNKSSEEVIRFVTEHWLPVFGAPRVLVADQGREFISLEFEQFCARHSIFLWHTAVQAPWQNGICERGGGILKTILSAVVASQSILGFDEMKLALSEAVMAYNQDINEAGCSPMQAALGRQPRMVGDVLGGIQQRLAEHGLINDQPSFARQIAMREIAKVAMTRLHFSRGLRKAELGRSRGTTMEEVPEPGSICYYFRAQKYNSNAASKKKLLLKRWHGPALMVAVEGGNCYLSHKGHLTKCALEHVRKASSMEQIAAETWRDAIEEAAEAALHDMARVAPAAPPTPGRQPPAIQAAPHLEEQVPETPLPLPGEMGYVGGDGAVSVGDMVPLTPIPLQPSEIVQAMQPPLGASNPSTPADSRRMSLEPSRRTSVGDGSDGSRVQELRARLQPIVERSRSPPPISTSSINPQQQLQPQPPPLSISTSQTTPSTMTATSGKRPAELTTSQLEQQQASQPSASGGSEVLVATHEELLELAMNEEVHPLVQAQSLAFLDLQDPLEAEAKDHGSWDGRWPLPSRSQWQARELLGLVWPSGRDEFETDAVQAARKEYHWATMTNEQRKEFGPAALQGWKVWLDNQAVEVMSREESQKVLRELSERRELHKVLTPRYVYTDKHDGVRTANRPLPLKASARLVVPGFKDESAMYIRKDAPTASRISQHLLLTLASSHFSGGWRLWSADIKSAFLKGDPYMTSLRTLYIQNLVSKNGSPVLPMPEGCLARIRKGVFGLADAPRQWYLRLNRALQERGWERMTMDYAGWLLWSKTGELEGMMLSHVDDLLMTGSKVAEEHLKSLGEELGFGSIDQGSFMYCGKRIEQKTDGTVEISMKEYHQNLKPAKIPADRRLQPDDELNATELRQLRALLGSLQWLVAQLRFDQAFALSTLQGERPRVSTLMKANQLVKAFKQHSDFCLRFKPMNLSNAGIMVVTDSSLGNVMKDGSVGPDPLKRSYSQSCYYVLIADEDLLAGKEGSFTVLDARSHRIDRVCRSTFAAELLGTEEGMDAGQFCRGYLAAIKGFSLEGRRIDQSLNAIPMVIVTDAKDVYDKSNSDTPSYGTQKSLAFTITWIRSMLRRANTSLRWTATSNMFADAGTKEMSLEHLHSILQACRWCARYSTAFTKQAVKTPKKKVSRTSEEAVTVGTSLKADDPIVSHLMTLSDEAGWYDRDGVGINVSRHARSYRTPQPRFDPAEFPIRSTYARFDHPNGQSEWRQLEHKVSYGDLRNSHGLIGDTADILITFFHGDPSMINKIVE